MRVLGNKVGGGCFGRHHHQVGTGGVAADDGPLSPRGDNLDGGVDNKRCGMPRLSVQCSTRSEECSWTFVLHPACLEKGVHQSCCISSRLASSLSASPTSQTTCSHRAQGRPSPARRKDQGLKTRRSYRKLLPRPTVNLFVKDVMSEHAIPALADVRKRMHNRVLVEIRLQCRDKVAVRNEVQSGRILHEPYGRAMLKMIKGA
jgi:hypothetical protein